MTPKGNRDEVSHRGTMTLSASWFSDENSSPAFPAHLVLLMQSNFRDFPER